MAMPKKYDDHEFQKVWNSSKSAKEVARHFGTSEGAVRTHASKLRYLGYKLRRFYKGGRFRNQCVILSLDDLCTQINF